jgi:RNA 3'-terminal phosphate cyclase
LLQISLPCIIFGSGETTVEYTGGTNVILSPSIDYIEKILLPTLKSFGVDVDLKCVKRFIFQIV